MNSKEKKLTPEETVRQAIRDLRDHQKHLEMAYNQYLDNNLEDYVEVMDKFYDERVNIATNLFKDFSMKPRPEGTLYRRPESTPPFKSRDFRSTDGKKSLPYPMIIGQSTKRMSGVPRLIAKIDRFIEQLDTKLKNRKDLQKNNPFQLTEAKLKQMILEAMNPLRTAAAIEQLEKDIYEMEQLVKQFNIINDDVYAMSRKQYAAAQEMNGELWDMLDKKIMRALDELVNIESKIRPISIRYNILAATNPSHILHLMNKKLQRRKSK